MLLVIYHLLLTVCHCYALVHIYAKPRPAVSLESQRSLKIKSIVITMARLHCVSSLSSCEHRIDPATSPGGVKDAMGHVRQVLLMHPRLSVSWLCFARMMFSGGHYAYLYQDEMISIFATIYTRCTEASHDDIICNRCLLGFLLCLRQYGLVEDGW